MRKTSLLIGAVGALSLLSACASGGGYRAAAFNEGGPADVYYDGFYGPYTDGYWDGDAYVYRGGDGHFVRDEAHHFRRDRFEHAEAFHAGRRPR
jgi:hypothetical protein